MFINFRGLKKEQEVLLTHGDSLDGVAEGFKAIAHSGSLIAGEADQELNTLVLHYKFYITQFVITWFWI